MGRIHATVDVGGLRPGARSAETRSKMIQVAIEVFAELGYEAASTRILADRAGVNLAAIPYHFGGKRELYVAAALQIADYARGRIDPVVSRLRDPSRADLSTRIKEAFSSYFHLVVGGPEPESWISFFVRCERDADDAFHLIHDEAVTRFERALTQSIAEARGCDADDESLKIRVSMLLASIFSIRTLRNVTLNSLGWDRLNPERIQKLETIITEFSLRELLAIPVGAHDDKQQPKPKTSQRSRPKAVYSKR